MSDTKFETARQVDDPLVMDANYRFGPKDRRYIDNQIRAVQQYLVDDVIPQLAGSSNSAGKVVKAMADANQALTAAEAKKGLVQTTGALTAKRTLTVEAPAADASSFSVSILNTCTPSGSDAAAGIVVVSVGTGQEIEIEPGAKALVQITPSGVQILVDLPLDPRDFGCPWNGTDDDLPGLEAMLASIPATRERRTVVQLPKGPGYCSDNWRINRNVDVRGHGRSYIAQTEPFNGLRFPPLRGVIVDGAYTSSDSGWGDHVRLRDLTVESQMAIVSDPVAGLGRARRYIDTSKDIWSELSTDVVKGTCVIASGSAGTGAQTDYMNEGACRGGVLVMFRCTTAGTKGSAEPATFATAGVADIGTTIAATGGTAVWTVESVPKDYENAKPYVVGERVVVPGDPDHVFECIGAGTSMTGAVNYDAWGIPIRVPSSFVAPPYRDEFYDKHTTIAVASDGLTLPQATIEVADTTDFDAAGTAYVYTSAGWEAVAYTGKTATTLTGCTGGAGTMSTGGYVGQGVKWKHIPASGITILANWVDVEDVTIAGATGCAVWIQANAGVAVSANGVAGGSNFCSVRNCIVDSCGGGITTNSNNTNGCETSHIQHVFLGGGRTDVDAAAYLNITDGKWGTGSAGLKDRTQGTNAHWDHYVQFAHGMPFRNDLIQAGGTPIGNYARIDKMVHETTLQPKYVSPAVVTNGSEPTSDSDAMIVEGTGARNIKAVSPLSSDATKSLEATHGPQNSAQAGALVMQVTGEPYSVGFNVTDDTIYQPPKWLSFGKAGGTGFYTDQVFVFPRPGAGGTWPTGATVNPDFPMPAWFAQDHIWIGQSPVADPPSIGFGTAAPTTGYWVQGSVVWNRTATVGQPNGWRCTVTGTPGTWVAMANL